MKMGLFLMARSETRKVLFIANDIHMTVLRKAGICVTKKEFVTRVCQKTYYNRSVVESILETVLNTITESLANGEKVQFSEFGTFEPKTRAARTGMNPHTRERVPIPPKVVPSFRAGKALKNAVTKTLG